MMLSPDNVDELHFGDDGLLPVIAQDVDSGEVLMVAWANREAVDASLVRGKAVFWSRSRQQLWEKGETSGHTLSISSIHADCDRDTLLMLVKPNGAACHTGTMTCFSDGPLTRSGAYGFLATLDDVIDQRIRSSDPKSYTARLIAEGPKRLAQKVGEEGVEAALALSSSSNDDARNEAADLLFHLIVALKARGMTLTEVIDELDRRHRKS
jgi:phosphoribosyl-AMP cyclohydrolase / phosphoribosyl-ATP pyrophosphohydrolase